MDSRWYDCIEPEIRALVLLLRENGINTTCSCGHEGWIECETYDATAELHAVYALLREAGYRRFHIEIAWDVGDNGCDSKMLRITADGENKAVGEPVAAQHSRK